MPQESAVSDEDQVGNRFCYLETAFHPLLLGSRLNMMLTKVELLVKKKTPLVGEGDKL